MYVCDVCMWYMCVMYVIYVCDVCIMMYVMYLCDDVCDIYMYVCMYVCMLVCIVNKRIWTVCMRVFVCMYVCYDIKHVCMYAYYIIVFSNSYHSSSTSCRRRPSPRWRTTWRHPGAPLHRPCTSWKRAVSALWWPMQYGLHTARYVCLYVCLYIYIYVW